MEFEKLIAISGKGSLYKIVSRTNFGLIAEGIEDGKRIPVHASNQVSKLDDISMYAESSEVPLREVFLKIFEKYEGKAADVDGNDNNALKAWMETILPDYDKERVYTSDIKKLAKWYNQLAAKGDLKLEDLKPAEEVKAEGEEKEKDKEKEKKEKPEKKKDTSKTSANKNTKTTVKNAPAKKVQTVRKAGGS